MTRDGSTLWAFTCLAAGTASVSPIGLMPAWAGNAFERMIEAARPCEPLKVDTALFTVGIDRLGGVDVEKLMISILDDAAVLQGRATLACKTSDNAELRGDASVTMELDAEMNLLDCKIGRLDVRVVDMDGSLRGPVEALRPVIVQSVRDGVRTELGKLCDQQLQVPLRSGSTSR